MLKELREAAGLSRLRLAIRAGLHPTTYGKIEKGNHRCNRATAERIAEALGVEPESVFPDYENLRRW